MSGEPVNPYVAAIDETNRLIAAKLRLLPPEAWVDFVTTVLGNMVGNTAARARPYFLTMEIKPCGAPGCNCHHTKRRVQAVLRDLAKDYDTRMADPTRN